LCGVFFDFFQFFAENPINNNNSNSNTIPVLPSPPTEVYNFPPSSQLFGYYQPKTYIQVPEKDEEDIEILLAQSAHFVQNQKVDVVSSHSDAVNVSSATTKTKKSSDAVGVEDPELNLEVVSQPFNGGEFYWTVALRKTGDKKIGRPNKELKAKSVPMLKEQKALLKRLMSVYEANGCEKTMLLLNGGKPELAAPPPPVQAQTQNSSMVQQQLADMQNKLFDANIMQTQTIQSLTAKISYLEETLDAHRQDNNRYMKERDDAKLDTDKAVASFVEVHNKLKALEMKYQELVDEHQQAVALAEQIHAAQLSEIAKLTDLAKARPASASNEELEQQLKEAQIEALSNDVKSKEALAHKDSELSTTKAALMRANANFIMWSSQLEVTQRALSESKKAQEDLADELEMKEMDRCALSRRLYRLQEDLENANEVANIAKKFAAMVNGQFRCVCVFRFSQEFFLTALFF
jgi:hypothetical protein